MIIRNARIVTLDAANQVIDSGAVEVRADGSIGSVGANPTAAKEGDVVDAHGKLLMPALINCHTHLYSTLARGMALGGRPPEDFPQMLRKLWWRLDSALDEQDIYSSALVGIIDSAKAGVGMLLDHHSSPNACPGSLDVIERAFREVGLRGVLCYETSDRNGPTSAAEAIAENVRFAEKVGGGDDSIGAIFGLHASFTLSDRTLRRCADAARTLGTGFHVHVAEDKCDVKQARDRYGKSPVRRLCDLGALDEKSIAAHCVHVSAADVSRLARHRVNVVHNPQSNCNNAVGVADISRMLRRSVLVGLGSDGYSPRMWEEFTAAYHVQKLWSHIRQKDADGRRVPDIFAIALHNNREITRKIWGWELGRIETGARADLMLVDYDPPTPLTPDSLFGHILFGIAHANVNSLMVNGKFVVRDHQCVTVDEEAISERARVRARKLWARL